jgi:hypothetical protein
MPVGSQGVGEHVGITAIVLGSGDGESIAEAVELFRVDRIDLEMARDYQEFRVWPERLNLFMPSPG